MFWNTGGGGGTFVFQKRNLKIFANLFFPWRRELLNYRRSNNLPLCSGVWLQAVGEAMHYLPVQRKSGESNWLKFMEIYGSFPGFNCLLLSGQSGEAHGELWPAWGLRVEGWGVSGVALTGGSNQNTVRWNPLRRQTMSEIAPQTDDQQRLRQKQRGDVWLLRRVGTLTWLSHRKKEELWELWLSRWPSIGGELGELWGKETFDLTAFIS